MFGDDPKNRSAVAKSLVKCAASPIDWLEQAYRLKRLADELIERWLLANRIAGVAQMQHWERYPPIDTSELNLKPGDWVPLRPGKQQSELQLRRIQSRAAGGSPATYMSLAGQSIENLSKGLYVRADPSVVETAERVAEGKPVLRSPANSHNTVKLLQSEKLKVALSDDELSIARRLEFAVTWHGRYPVPMRVRATEVSPWLDVEDSDSVGFWTTEFRPVVDRLYGRLFKELVEPGWFPYWEPDKFPV